MKKHIKGRKELDQNVSRKRIMQSLQWILF